jgi:hypothetical protein
MTILYNRVTGNGGGVLCGKDSITMISHNQISDNNFFGIYGKNALSAYVRYNNIAHNGKGIILWITQGFRISENNIADNKKYDIALMEGQTWDLGVHHNWWGTTDEKKIKGIPSEIQDLFYEALNTYRNGCYIACCLMCGRILEALVKDACDKNNIKFSGLGNGINELKTAGCLGGKHHSDLMSIVKYYRDKVVHPTGEAFDKDKAKWFLSSLLILIDELFQKA